MSLQLIRWPNAPWVDTHSRAGTHTHTRMHTVTPLIVTNHHREVHPSHTFEDHTQGHAHHGVTVDTTRALSTEHIPPPSPTGHLITIELQHISHTTPLNMLKLLFYIYIHEILYINYFCVVHIVFASQNKRIWLPHRDPIHITTPMYLLSAVSHIAPLSAGLPAYVVWGAEEELIQIITEMLSAGEF